MICQSNDLQLLSFIKNTSAETRSIRKFIDQYRSELSEQNKLHFISNKLLRKI